MKRLILLAAACCAATACADAPRPADYVNPNLGSIHSRWFFYTPAAEPFGMAKLGPSTNGSYTSPSGWEAVGYEDGHTSIEGFPCLHEFQVGGVLLMPTVGDVQTVPGRLEDPDAGFRSRFDKADEHAEPGYYSVLLKDYGVRAELTATTRVGFQRYTFPASEASNILFDIGNAIGESGPVVDALVRVTDPQHVEGYAVYERSMPRSTSGATVGVYFYAELSRGADSWQLYRRGETPLQGMSSAVSGPVSPCATGLRPTSGSSSASDSPTPRWRMPGPTSAPKPTGSTSMTCAAAPPPSGTRGWDALRSRAQRGCTHQVLHGSLPCAARPRCGQRCGRLLSAP